MVSTNFFSYSKEDNRNAVGARMMYPLQYKGVKLMDLKKNFGIKDATTNNIPGDDIRNDPDTE